MIVSVVVGKAGHTGAHISPANCTDLACPAFLACLVHHNVADFVDDSGLDLEISREWVSQTFKTMKKVRVRVTINYIELVRETPVKAHVIHLYLQFFPKGK